MSDFFGYDSDPDGQGISEDEDSTEEFTPRLARLAAELIFRGSAPHSYEPAKVLKAPCAVNPVTVGGSTAAFPLGKGCRTAPGSPASTAKPTKDSTTAKVILQPPVGARNSRPTSAPRSKACRAVLSSRATSASQLGKQSTSPSTGHEPPCQPRHAEATYKPPTPGRTAGGFASAEAKRRPGVEPKPHRTVSPVQQRSARSKSGGPSSPVNFGSGRTRSMRARAENALKAAMQAPYQMPAPCSMSPEGFTGATLEVCEHVPQGSTSTIYRSSSSQRSWEETISAQRERELGRASFFSARLAGAGLLSRVRGKSAELLPSGLSLGARASIRHWIRGSISGLHALLLVLDSEGMDCDVFESRLQTEHGPSSQAISAISGGFVDILGVAEHRLGTTLFRGSPLEALERYADAQSGTSVAEVNLCFRRQLASVRDPCDKLQLRIEHELLRVYAAGNQAANQTSRQDNAMLYASSSIDAVQEEWSKSADEIRSESETLPAATLEARNQAVEHCLMRMIRLKKALVKQRELFEHVDHYAILGVAPEATDAEVRRAYREACLRCHPDKPGGDTELFQKLQVAYTAVVEERRLRVTGTPTPRGCSESQARRNASEQGEAGSPDDVSDGSSYLAETKTATKIVEQAADEVGSAAQVILRSWAVFVDAGYPEDQALTVAQNLLENAEKATGSTRRLGEQAVEISGALAALAGLSGSFLLSTDDLRGAASACGVLGTRAIFAASDVARGCVCLRDSVQTLELAVLLKAPKDTVQALGEAFKQLVAAIEVAVAAVDDALQAARAAETIAASFVQDLARARQQSATAAKSKEEEPEEAKEGEFPARDWSREAQDFESDKEDAGCGNCNGAQHVSPKAAAMPSGRSSARKVAAYDRRVTNHRLLQQLQVDLSQLQGEVRGLAADACKKNRYLSNLRQILLHTLCDGARVFQNLVHKSKSTNSMSIEKAFSLSLGFVEAKAWGGPITLPRSAAAQILRVSASLDPAGLARMLQEEVWPQVLQIAWGDPNVQRRCDAVIDTLHMCEMESQS